jgi:hypothetical protein
MPGNAAAQLSAAYRPPTGRFPWVSGYPSSLASFWRQGGSNLIDTGAIMAFESDHGSPANTGIPVAPTSDGTSPVYLRYRFQVTQGTNPDGTHYADPVQFVSYFRAGEAVHYFPRYSYGWPQSLGCVELPLAAAAQVWPYLTCGSLVTVTPLAGCLAPGSGFCLPVFPEGLDLSPGEGKNRQRLASCTPRFRGIDLPT